MSDIHFFNFPTDRTGGKEIMLTVEKLSRRPGTFRRLTGTDADTFYEIAEKIRPLRRNAGIIPKREAESIA